MVSGLLLRYIQKGGYRLQLPRSMIGPLLPSFMTRNAKIPPFVLAENTTTYGTNGVRSISVFHLQRALPVGSQLRNVLDSAFPSAYRVTQQHQQSENRPDTFFNFRSFFGRSNLQRETFFVDPFSRTPSRSTVVPPVNTSLDSVLSSKAALRQKNRHSRMFGLSEFLRPQYTGAPQATRWYPEAERTILYKLTRNICPHGVASCSLMYPEPQRVGPRARRAFSLSL